MGPRVSAEVSAVYVIYLFIYTRIFGRASRALDPHGLWPPPGWRWFLARCSRFVASLLVTRWSLSSLVFLRDVAYACLCPCLSVPMSLSLCVFVSVSLSLSLCPRLYPRSGRTRRWCLPCSTHLSPAVFPGVRMPFSTCPPPVFSLACVVSPHFDEPSSS